MKELFFSRQPVILDTDWIDGLPVKVECYPNCGGQSKQVSMEARSGTMKDFFLKIEKEEIQSVPHGKIETAEASYLFPFLSNEAGNRFLWLACKLWCERRVFIYEALFFPIRKMLTGQQSDSDQFFICIGDKIVVEDFSLVYSREKPWTHPKILNPGSTISADFVEMMYGKFYRETYFGILLSFQEFGVCQEEAASKRTLRDLERRMRPTKGFR